MREKTLYSSARSSQSTVYSPGEAPLIELMIPRDSKMRLSVRQQSG